MTAAPSADGWRRDLARRGVLVRDNMLAEDRFRILNDRVHRSWLAGCNWNTRIKGAARPTILPRQQASSVERIAGLLAQRKDADPDAFTYLYHSLHSSSDEGDLIADIEHEVLGKWRPALPELVEEGCRTNFSLTAFTKGCHLDEHTDFDTGDGRYKVAILFYFATCSRDESVGPLLFRKDGRVRVIHARPNRSVLFIPSSEMAHWIEPIERPAARLAFSGWLL